jgi:hypothetical protein
MSGERCILPEDALAFADPECSSRVLLAMNSAFMGAEAISSRDRRKLLIKSQNVIPVELVLE